MYLPVKIPEDVIKTNLIEVIVKFLKNDHMHIS